MSESTITDQRHKEIQLTLEGLPDVLAPAKPALPDARRRLRIPEWLLGQGTWPLNLAADLLAIPVLVAIAAQFVTLGAVIFAIFVVAIFVMMGLYRSRLSMSVLDDMPRLLCGLVVASGFSALISATLAPMLGLTHNIDAHMFWFGISAHTRSSSLAAHGYDRPSCANRGWPRNPVQADAYRYRRPRVQGLEVSFASSRRRNRICDKLEYLP